ncbi:MAG: glycosyltransferase family 9 protein, partial [Bacteroidales bacterium]|nr:glycosyltransferase family 9 protein [Bacteroidales bacterium]
MKILIFRLSAIGDIVLTTALLRNVRKTFPDAQIDFVVKKQFASLLDSIPYVSNVYEFDSKKGLKGLFALRKTLAACKYDVLLDIHKNWRSWFVTSSIHGKRYAYKKMVFKRSLLVKFKIDWYKPPRPVYLRFLDAAQALGVGNDGEKTSLVVPHEAREFVANLLNAGGIPADGKYIIVCPGASFSNKQYPVELLTQVVRQLLQQSYSIVLLGGSKEETLCADIEQQAHSQNIVNLAGKCNLTQSAAVVAGAQLTIANDTGMLHISEACGVPVVGLYGP